jgi:hypothetical protein
MRQNAYRFLLGYTFCIPLAALAQPATRAVRVVLTDGPRIAWTKCAIAAFTNAHVAEAATCTNAPDTTTCLLGDGHTLFAAQWSGPHAGVFVGEALVARMRQTTPVSADLVLGIDPASPHDSCELRLDAQNVLKVVWTAAK